MLLAFSILFVSTSQVLASGYSRTIKSEEQLLNELKVEKEETLDERFEIVESNIRGLESSSSYYAANGITK
ncbi:hypothetical protein K144316041_p10580 (plasmid) [Clostridium tetani]|uniref:hypothetical protein n=1 Tax=Clostridium tetani TaxID=1513 RepID=UPI0029544360|nr:hypothetical protein [Clostridium tetani]BDR74130.1 hypothetical protein K144316041_p10580 [Clostridium tetani]